MRSRSRCEVLGRAKVRVCAFFHGANTIGLRRARVNAASSKRRPCELGSRGRAHRSAKRARGRIPNGLSGRQPRGMEGPATQTDGARRRPRAASCQGEGHGSIDSHRAPHLPPVRGHLRPGDRRRRPPRDVDSRRSRRRVQPRLRVPEGCRPGTARCGPRPTAGAPGAARRRARSGVVGRGLRRDRTPPDADRGAARQRRGGAVPRQPDGSQHGALHLRTGAGAGAADEEHLHGQHRRPDSQAAGQRSPVRHLHERRRAGHRSHRLPARPRRQPDGLQRQLVDGARLPGPAARPAGARRPLRRRRPAAQPHRRGSGRARVHPPRHRRAPADGNRPHPVRRRAREARAAGRPRRRRRRGGSGCRAVFARGGGPPLRRVGGDDPPPRARSGGGAARRRLRPHRHLHPAVRHRRELAGRRLQRPDGQPRRPRRRHVSPRAGVRRQQPRDARDRPRRAYRSPPQPRARRARGAGGAAGGLPGRGDRNAGRGTSPRPDHHRRQPGPQHAQRRAPGASPGLARVHGQPRHLSQRDDPPRRRDPARPVAARGGALRRRLSPVRVSQRRPLLARRSSRRPASGRTSGRPCCA